LESGIVSPYELITVWYGNIIKESTGSNNSCPDTLMTLYMVLVQRHSSYLLVQCLVSRALHWANMRVVIISLHNGYLALLSN